MRQISPDLTALPDSRLFRGLSPEELPQILGCLGSRFFSYCKGENLFHVGDEVHSIYLVLKGCVTIGREDYFGNRTIIASIGPGGMLGEAFACSPQKRSTVNAEAQEETELLLLNAEKLLSPCAGSCPHHLRMLRNLVEILAQKNQTLNEKIQHLSARTTREKLLSYLTAESKTAGSRSFAIPFTRQELADALCVERSAMCAELSRMKREGILDYRKNQFTFPESP